MGLDSAIQHLLKAKRISAPSQSYAKDNPAEWAKVKAYLDGGVRPSGVTTEMGLGLVEVEDARRAVPPSPDPATHPIQRLTRVQITRCWNKCKPPAGVGAMYPDVDCNSGGFQPWPAPGGIREISEGGRLGLELGVLDQMIYPGQAGSTQKIARVAYGDPPDPIQLGQIQTYRGWLSFPRAGNPDGFLNHWNGAVLWETPTGPDPGNVLAVDVGTMRWRWSIHKGTQTWEHVLGPPVVWDVPTEVEWTVLWSDQPNGRTRLRIAGQLVFDRTMRTFYNDPWVTYFQFKASRGVPLNMHRLTGMGITLKQSFDAAMVRAFRSLMSAREQGEPLSAAEQVDLSKLMAKDSETRRDLARP